MTPAGNRSASDDRHGGVCECHWCSNPDPADRVDELELRFLAPALAERPGEWDERRTDRIIAAARRTQRWRQIWTTTATIVLVILAAFLGLRLTMGS